MSQLAEIAINTGYPNVLARPFNPDGKDLMRIKSKSGAVGKAAPQEG